MTHYDRQSCTAR